MLVIEEEKYIGLDFCFMTKKVAMFVKPLGDIRMPEHSTEYIVPLYNQDGEIQDPSTGNDSFVQPFPYFYQTSRDPKDNGFEKIQ